MRFVSFYPEKDPDNCIGAVSLWADSVEMEALMRIPPKFRGTLRFDFVNIDDPLRAAGTRGSRCWLGRPNKDGYTESRVVEGQTRRFGHILSREWCLDEEIPQDYSVVVDHLCRVRNCVNPWHSEVITVQENVRRGMAGQKRG